MPQLEFVKGANSGRRVPITVSRFVIGRQFGCDLRLDDVWISREHVVIRRSTEDGWVVEDQMSENGCYVNSERVARRVLRDGDLLRVGSSEMRFLADDGIDAAQAPTVESASRRTASREELERAERRIGELELELAASRAENRTLSRALHKLRSTPPTSPMPRARFKGLDEDGDRFARTCGAALPEAPDAQVTDLFLAFSAEDFGADSRSLVRRLVGTSTPDDPGPGRRRHAVVFGASMASLTAAELALHEGVDGGLIQLILVVDSRRPVAAVRAPEAAGRAFCRLFGMAGTPTLHGRFDGAQLAKVLSLPGFAVLAEDTALSGEDPSAMVQRCRNEGAFARVEHPRRARGLLLAARVGEGQIDPDLAINTYRALERLRITYPQALGTSAVFRGEGEAIDVVTLTTGLDLLAFGPEDPGKDGD